MSTLLLAVIFVQGVLGLTTSPLPGTRYEGDGHAIMVVAADNVVIARAEFVGVSILLPAEIKGTVIVDSTISGIRQDPRGCYYGGGQAIMIGNAEGNPPKLILNNTVTDYDCIAYSLYNHGPVHNVSLIGNQDDGGTRGLYTGLTWSVLGPKDSFSGLTLIGNEFRGWTRIGHGAWRPEGSNVRLIDNIFHHTVTFEFLYKPGDVVELGNDYRTTVWR